MRAYNMKLYEFFGNINRDDKEDDKHPEQMRREEEQELSDNLFWHLLDDNQLHKEFFMPAASDIYKKHKNKTVEDTHDWKLWMPMVNKGCVEFYKKHDIKGDPKDVFHKDLRIAACKRLADHYHDDIVKGEYKLGH